MAQITVLITDQTGARVTPVGLPDDVPLHLLLPALVIRMNLPSHQCGQPIAYFLDLISGRRLRPGDTLRRSGVQEGDVLRLMPSTSAGGYLPPAQLASPIRGTEGETWGQPVAPEEKLIRITEDEIRHLVREAPVYCMMPPMPPPRTVDIPWDRASDGSESLLSQIRILGAASPDSPRYLNSYFTRPDETRPIPDLQPLIRDQEYDLYVDISPERKGPGADWTAFPDRTLDPIWDDRAFLPLTVIVTSRDFAIPERLYGLQLPRQGSAPEIRFRVRPACAPGWGSIRVEVFYRGYLLQAKRVEALVVAYAGAELPTTPRPAQTARTIFTTTEQLTWADVALLPERILTIDVASDPRDGSFDLVVLDRTSGEHACYDTRLNPTSLGRALAGVRRQLLEMATGVDPEGRKVPGYRDGVDGDDARLNYWLPRLAAAGSPLYREAFPMGQGQPGNADWDKRLPATRQAGTVIQVNPVYGVVTVPWALLYQRSCLPAGQTRLCRGFAACRPEDADRCPDQDPAVICPYAFWGYRYAIEQLPCWTHGDTAQPASLVRRIDNGWPLQLNFNVYRNLRKWQQHLGKLNSAGAVRPLLAEDVAQLRRIWAEQGATLDVVYFYSHSRVDQTLGMPYLEMSDGRIDNNFLDAVRPRWPHHPLVFLNACATGDYGPESYVSLIDDFRRAESCGVVGTECPLPEDFAEAYAAALLPRFFQGKPLGQTMLDVRREFLWERKNPLGLLYSLYAAHEIALAQPVAAETGEDTPRVFRGGAR